VDVTFVVDVGDVRRNPVTVAALAVKAVDAPG
jgi:hypothetical protein